MNLKIILSIGFLLTSCTVKGLATEPPNFVLVYVDDLGWAETSVEMIKGRADTRSDYYQISASKFAHGVPPVSLLSNRELN